MYGQLAMITRFLILLIAVTLDTHPPQAPTLVLLAVLVSAVVLAPAFRSLVRTMLRALSSAAHAPPGPPLTDDSHEARIPTAPGIPGSVRARAPSVGVHAFA